MRDFLSRLVGSAAAIVYNEEEEGKRKQKWSSSGSSGCDIHDLFPIKCLI